MSAKIAIVDYRLGNLYSVKLACEHVGLGAEITSNKDAILGADAVILPGVGAFGDAMDALDELDLVSVLRDVAASGKPLFGICLGLQLLMKGSEEFGAHEGLGIIKGNVVKLDAPRENGRVLKVPQVGWNRVNPADGVDWNGTLMQGVTPGERFYFVHSFVVVPEDKSLVCSTTTYGHIEFCSSVRYGNVFACQYHPERSGARGLRIYRNLADILSK
ncbi:MAG: imidazole glycerol phosphate synthase subunit HisH [Proteobacteria bacterium]|nr:imidazole glycerol phosphate synthase subunit HisH [Pseudomonadota bacterium]MBU1611671.1 imidazole glycerol phosphate synthase subunit HisH [Pseudomonadota bacterium]